MDLMKLVLRGLARNPRRTLLTFLGLVVSFFVYTSLASILFTLEQVIHRTGSATTLFLRPKFGIRFWRAEIPLTYLSKIRAVPGVVTLTPYDFFLGEGKKKGEFDVAIGVDPSTIAEVRDLKGASREELGAFRGERSAALVGDRTLEQHGWKLGQEVTLRNPIKGQNLPVRIRGNVDRDGDFGDVILVHNDYLQDVNGRTGKTVFVIVKVARSDLATPVARTIDEGFRNFTVPTETITEKAFTETVIGGLADTLQALTVIGYLTLGVTMLVVANTVAMGVRERTNEIGTMRALGFSARRVLAMVVGEASLVSSIGGIGGALLAWTIFHYQLIKLPEEVGLEIQASWRVVLQSSLLALPIGALAGLKPAWDASRMAITEALRHAD